MAARMSLLASIRSISLANRRAYVSTDPKPSTQLVKKTIEDVETVKPSELVSKRGGHFNTYLQIFTIS